MPTRVVATRNRGKLAEFAELLAAYGVEVAGLDAFPGVPEVEEDGETFAANALKKARAYSRATGCPVLAEDSGLEVDALGGEPGVRSARWVPGSDADRVQALLQRLEGVSPAARTARYVCALALARPDGREALFQATWEGRIAAAPRGSGGFGYDPVFLLPDGRTAAELSRAEKNAQSHRGQALRQALATLPDFLQG